MLTGCTTSKYLYTVVVNAKDSSDNVSTFSRLIGNLTSVIGILAGNPSADGKVIVTASFINKPDNSAVQWYITTNENATTADLTEWTAITAVTEAANNCEIDTNQLTVTQGDKTVYVCATLVDSATNKTLDTSSSVTIPKTTTNDQSAATITLAATSVIVCDDATLNITGATGTDGNNLPSANVTVTSGTGDSV